jgi:hypothetical protein
MSKNHLTKEDVTDIIKHLKNYDRHICECLKIGIEANDDDISDAIEIHNELEYLIKTLEQPSGS